MKKLQLLDLFCGAGGAAMGYARAGFEVVGVDIKPQLRYPFEFHQADALDYLDALCWTGEIAQFAAVHASPVCKGYTKMNNIHSRMHPYLVEPTRRKLWTLAIPWVLENVEMGGRWRGHMPSAIMVCGTALGLNVRRHRLFESSHLLLAPGACRHAEANINVYGHGAWDYRPRDPSRHWQRAAGKQRPVPLAAAQEAMEIAWMTQNELSQAIPPAYTEWIGRQLMQIVRQAA